MLPAAWPHKALHGNPYVPLSIMVVVLFQLLYTYAPFMQAMFHSTPLEFGAWLRIMLIAFSVYVIVELEKGIVRALKWRVV